MIDFDPSELDDGYVPSQDFMCDPDCCDYAEIWDEDELKEELALDDDNIEEEC